MTIENTWKLLQEEYKEFPRGKCQNVNTEQIIEVEKELELKLDKEYKYFLQHHEASTVGELRLQTVTRSESSSTSLWNILEANKWYKEKEKWPDIEDWCIVSNDGSGNPIGILPNGEVWVSYHDCYYYEGEVLKFEQEKLADSFKEFLYKLLTETLWGEFEGDDDD